MAVFNASQAADIQNGIPLLGVFGDFVDLNNAIAWYGAFQDESATGFKFAADANNYVQLIGTNFSYFFGVPQAGTIDTIQVYKNGSLAYTLSGVDITIAISFQLSDIGDFQALFNRWAAQVQTAFDTFSLRNHIVNGSTFVDILAGLQGNDIIRGKTGADDMYGLGGDDWFFVDNALDKIFEVAGQGTFDRVFAALSYTLTAGAEVELLSTNNHTGTAAINLTGNELGNLIYGNAGNNTLGGAAGNDTLVGADGNDVLQGDDQNDTLIGGDGDDDLQGGNDDDRLYGQAGTNQLAGGAGDDWYFVDSATDTVQEASNAGALDRVFASLSYTLSAGAYVEILSTNYHAGLNPID